MWTLMYTTAMGNIPSPPLSLFLFSYTAFYHDAHLTHLTHLSHLAHLTHFTHLTAHTLPLSHSQPNGVCRMDLPFDPIYSSTTLSCPSLLASRLPIVFWVKKSAITDAGVVSWHHGLFTEIVLAHAPFWCTHLSVPKVCAHRFGERTFLARVPSRAVHKTEFSARP